MKILSKTGQSDPRMDRNECEADCELAAELAANAAAAANEWAQASGEGEDDAAEATRAARRARVAAERVLLASTDSEARMLVAAAWAATESALEADQRVVTAIAEAIRVA